MNEKQLAGERAAEFVEDGMIIGLGTGSTVYYTIQKIGEMVKQGLKISGVPTSTSTTELAKSLGIPMLSINDVDSIDLTIDGSDEVDPQLNGIKGGGGALLFEKVVAFASRKVIWVVGSNKMVQTLGKFPLPVEVTQFGYKHVYKKLNKHGMNPVLRTVQENIFTTDSNNYILDLHLEKINNPKELAIWLNTIPGVVENGLFIDMADTVIVAKDNSLEIINRKP